jgi:hypothetical protein
MSSSPVLRRLSSAGSLRHSPGMDGLVNYYEAEEERIINLLSRKLEKVGRIFVFTDVLLT